MLGVSSVVTPMKPTFIPSVGTVLELPAVFAVAAVYQAEHLFAALVELVVT